MGYLVDVILAAFLAALGQGIDRLQPIGLTLCGFASTMHFYFRMLPMLLQAGSSQFSDTVGEFLLICISAGFTLWLAQNLPEMGEGLLQAALTWGAQAGGAELATTHLQTPSFLLAQHLRVTAPLEAYIQAHIGWKVLWNAPTVGLYWLAELFIFGVFAGLSLASALLQIEFQFALLAGVVFFGLIIWSRSQALGEFVVGWVLGATVRCFLLMAVVGIAAPLFEQLTLQPSAGTGLAEPTWGDVFAVVVGAALFGLLAWQIPARANQLLGVGLGFSGLTVASAAASTLRFATVAHTAVRGSSRLLGAVRG